MRRAAALASIVMLAGCDGAPADPGLLAHMRVSRGAFFPGLMPDDEGGPEVASMDLSNNQIRAGQTGKPLRGALAPEATAVALGLDGDSGYWIVPAGLPDVQAPKFPTFDVTLSFSLEIPSGPHTLVARAASPDGLLGPAHQSALTAEGPEVPEGALVVTLRWDREADLDLHVVDPSGVEIYKRNINSYEPPPPGKPADPSAPAAGAMLDFDSNAACVIDGRRQENIVWKAAAPPGHYIARVDTFSLCGEAFANWSAEARLGGVVIARAAGESGPADEAMPHDRGAGVLALQFDLP